MPPQVQQTNQVYTSQASTLAAEFTAAHRKDHCYFKVTKWHNGSLTHDAMNKELLALRAKEQGDDALLPAFYGMHLIN